MHSIHLIMRFEQKDVKMNKIHILSNSWEDQNWEIRVQEQKEIDKQIGWMKVIPNYVHGSTCVQ